MIYWSILPLVTPVNFFIVSSLLVTPSSQSRNNENSYSRISGNSLNGQHIGVIWTLWAGAVVGNKTVLGSKMNGPLMVLLGQRLNFTFEYDPITDTALDSSKYKSLIERSDLIIHEIYPSQELFRFLDFSMPWTYGSFGFLLPPSEKLERNVAAVIQPFQWPLWLLIALSVIILIPLIMGFSRLHSDLTTKKLNPILEVSQHGKFQENEDGNMEKSIQQGYVFLYVFGILLSQGGSCVWKSQSIRILAGVWCLATFVLINSYSSTLITYVIAFKETPLIDSVDDIVNRPHINLIIEKGKNLDNILSVHNNEGIYKELENRVNSYPRSRCTSLSECVNLVKNYKNNIFTTSWFWCMDIVVSDFKQTNKCNFGIAKGKFMNAPYIWALKKNSVYTKAIDKGLLELQAFGLPSYIFWRVRQLPLQARRCYATNLRLPTQTVRKLTLSNLTGCFVVLFVGYTLSAIVFLFEKCIFRSRIVKMRNYSFHRREVYR